MIINVFVIGMYLFLPTGEREYEATNSVSSCLLLFTWYWKRWEYHFYSDQSEEQRPHWTIHYTEEMSWEIWMLDLRNAFYPGNETQTEHSIRLNKSETI